MVEQLAQAQTANSSLLSLGWVKEDVTWGCDHMWCEGR